MKKVKLSKRVLSLAIVCMLVMSLAACGGGGGATTNGGDPQGEPETTTISGDLTLYTSEPEELVTEMIAAFNKDYPDVNIELFRSGTGKVVAKMEAELETGSTPANIVWFADIGYIKGLDDKGLIMHYIPKGAENVDPQYCYNDGMGNEVRLIYNVIAYNTNEVKTAPKDWKDVTTAEYNGTFALANPNYSGGAFSALVVHTMYPDKVGWDWYQALADNNCKYEESNGNLQTKVSSGEYKAVEIVDFMGRNAKRDGSPVDVTYPESGAVLVPTPMALLSNIPEESVDAAKAFSDWCLTEAAQKMMVGQGYIPVTPIDGPEGAPKVADIKVLPFDLDYFVNESSAIRQEYTDRFGGAKTE